VQYIGLSAEKNEKLSENCSIEVTRLHHSIQEAFNKTIISISIISNSVVFCTESNISCYEKVRFSCVELFALPMEAGHHMVVM